MNKLTDQEAEAILKSMQEIVESLDYPAIILIATEDDGLLCRQARKLDGKIKSVMFCAASIALSKLLTLRLD